jgi:hypothetical protein
VLVANVVDLVDTFVLVDKLDVCVLIAVVDAFVLVAAALPPRALTIP